MKAFSFGCGTFSGSPSIAWYMDFKKSFTNKIEDFRKEVGTEQTFLVFPSPFTTDSNGHRYISEEVKKTFLSDAKKIRFVGLRPGTSMIHMLVKLITKKFTPEERGMLEQHDSLMKEFAKKNDLLIIVRNPNGQSLRWVGKTGYRPKPEGLSAKTITEGPNAGLVGASPKDPRLAGFLRAKKITYGDLVKQMEADEYSIAEDYVVAKNGEKFHSDLDLHGIYKGQTGISADTEDMRALINKEVFDNVEMVQHGSHDQWLLKNEFSSGPNRGPQVPVTAYLPSGEVRVIQTLQGMKDIYRAYGIEWWKIYPHF